MRRIWRTLPCCLAVAFGPLAAACLDPEAPGNLVPKTVDQDPSLPAIEISDTKLHAEAFGDPTAPMIMVLHGGPGGDYRSLLPMRSLVEDGYFVVLWDQRGAGLSRRHTSHYADAKIITVRGVGHEGIWERPDEFLRHIRAYLTEVLP